MKLIIDIPEGLKKDFELEQWTALSCMEMKDALEKATPLPKGHGKIVDADKTIANAYEVYSAVGTPCIITSDQMYAIREVLTAAQAIIEADTESEDKE